MVDSGFPRGGGANSQVGGGECRQFTILPNFPKNCMKLKEFGPQGAGVPLRSPIATITNDFSQFPNTTSHANPVLSVAVVLSQRSNVNSCCC